MPATGYLALPAQLAAGLLLFLFGMRQLEGGIGALGYNAFKRWLSRSSASPLGSAAVGVGVTAIVQSSSLVSLLVLAFASAGALPLYNAVGIILGANLGTTITGWMVATIGFKLSLQQLALPLMAGGALLQLPSRGRTTVRGAGMLLFGIGLILFGLESMKSAVGDLPGQWDLGVLRGGGAWAYFLAGAGIAALIQSSSATMMLALAALHAGLLDLPGAAALAIGADLGTTSTTALGSIGGHYIKRQLALAHFLFNLVVDLAAFFLLLPLLPALLGLLHLRDPLYSLVAFHSLFNLIGLLAFLPLLKPYSRWIGGRFLAGAQVDRPLAGQPTAVPDAALLAIDQVLEEMRLDAAVLNLHSFQLRPDQLQAGEPLQGRLQECARRRADARQRYHRIKLLESDLLAFSIGLQERKLEPAQVARLARQVREARALVYGSKTLNDIRENLVGLRHAEQADVRELYAAHRNIVRGFYRHYLPLAELAAPTAADRDQLQRLAGDNEAHYREANERVHGMAAREVVGGFELSTMLNVNREIHHALKNLLLALE